jgi:2-polyprenyl-6-methoxyphenol hydroxylase-like FAD-dependent oxidoreductase
MIRGMRVLISGASVAGPVAAYWLARYGFEVTVVERAATGHQAGGHAVDLFRPAMQVVRRMGIGDAIRANTTGMDSITAFRLGSDRPVEVDLRPIFTVISDDHVEIMRDDLSEALRGATEKFDVEYLFGRTIAELHDGHVIFDDGTERRFDIVLGADGLHSNVRHLAFGDEAGRTAFLGTYLAVATVPRPSTAGATFVCDLGPNRLIGCYCTAGMTDARLIFLYRPTGELGYDRNNRAAQKQLLRAAYAGFGARVEGWLDDLDRTDVFYLEGISQVVMDTWSAGRVSLVGDAGYCPGPAVGGGTSLAVVGAYVLAGELAECGGDYGRAFAAYEAALEPYVVGSRRLGRRIARVIPPARNAAISAVFLGAGALSHLPNPVLRALGRLDRKNTRLHDSVEIREYGTA